MNNDRWLVPSYYPNFQCKADKCRHSCCSSWHIPITRQEYYRLITMECSDELNRRIQYAFIVPETVSDECYRYISFNWLGECPIQEKGLCYLHREKGEDYLPRVCRLYPRSLKKINDQKVASCSSSCEKVVEMLYEMDSLEMIEIEMAETPQLLYSLNEEDIKQIISFQDIIRDETTSLAQSIADICKIINKEEFEKDYASDFDPLKEALRLLNKYSFSNEVLHELLDFINERYEDESLYEKDRENFEEFFPGWMTFFERLINNSMIYECFPFFDKRADKTSTYKGLCICYGLLRVVCVAQIAASKEKDKLIDAVVSLFHLIDHTAFYYNAALLCENAAALLKL